MRAVRSNQSGAEPSFFVENTKRKEAWKKKKSQGIRGGEGKEDRLMGKEGMEVC